MKGMIKWIILALVLFGLAFGGAYFFQQRVNQTTGGKVTTIAADTMKALQAEAPQTAFVGSFVAVIGGVPTTIMPGVVRYGLDFKKMKAKDAKWDQPKHTLTVTIPPLALSAPEIDMANIRQVDAAGALTILADAEATLDPALRKRGQDDVLKQAKGEASMELAHDAARGAIQRSFAMPLSAAGIKATVVAKFADE